MMCGSRDMKCGGENFLSSWAISCPFNPTNQKNQNFGKMKKKKKHLGISSFYTSAPKIIIICYTILEIWHVTDVIIFHFGLFFTLPPHPIRPKNQINKKMKKTPGDIILLHTSQKLWSDDAWFPRYGVRRTDRWTGRLFHFHQNIEHITFSHV